MAQNAYTPSIDANYFDDMNQPPQEQLLGVNFTGANERKSPKFVQINLKMFNNFLGDNSSVRNHGETNEFNQQVETI